MMDALVLVTLYEKGAIVADELVVRCLLMIDPDDPARVLDALPRETLPRVLEFVGKYRSGRLVSSCGGPLPAVNQVDAAGGWIEAALRKDVSAVSSGA